MNNNWRNVPLSEIADINPRLGKTALSDDSLYSFVPMASVGAADGSIDVSVKRPLAEVKKGFTPFQSGDVLFAKITPCMENGKMAVVPKLENNYGFGSTEFHVIRPKAGIDPMYVYYFVSCSDFRREAGHNMTGAVGQKRVPTDFLKQSLIPLPPTVEDQKQIVAEIEKQFSRLDEAVASLKRIQANLKRYKAAVLKAAVEGKLTEQWRKDHPAVEPADQLLKRILAERRAKWEAVELAKMQDKGIKPKDDSWKKKYKESAGPDTANLPKLPAGWVWATLGQCFRVAVGATPSRKEPTFWNGDIPWVSSGEVQFSRVRSTKENITKEGLKNSSTQINPAGSVLLGMIGEGKTRGQAAILEIPAANNQNCAAIWVSETPVTPEYIYFWFVQSYEETRRIGSGNNQQALNKAIVEMMPFPLSPIIELNKVLEEIDCRLSVTEKLEITIETNLKRAERLRQTILQRAFSGGLM